ncbi:MAG TPA: NAD-dependent epimerase/dehydratase family protein [Acidimicrobiales bacterium]
MMRIAVTGATGNVGTSLLARLAANDRVDEVVGIARRPPEVAVPKVRWVGADTADDDLRPHLEGADAVVHLAWLFQPTHRPVVTWRANVIGSERVFAAAADVRVGAVVHASSVGAYSPAPGRVVDESWPTHSLPTAAYGREKAYVECILDTFERRHPDVRVVRLRPGFIFQRPAATAQRRLFLGPLVPNLVARRGRLPFVPLPAGLRFQALHADDAAEAFHTAVMSAASGPFNIAAAPVIDHDVLADLLGTRVVSVPRPVLRAGLAAAWHSHLVPTEPALLDLVLDLPLLDTTRATRELGWSPRTTGPEAVRELLDGMAAGAGRPTAPLAPDSAAGRAGELAGGIGERP